MVLLPEIDEMGHIESDHGSWAKVTYSHRGIRYTENISSDDFIVIETIEVDESDMEEEE